MERCAGFANPLLIGADAHRFLLGEAVRSAGRAPLLITEPSGKNTCAAAAVAALEVQSADPDALVLLLPADHRVDDPGAFRDAVLRGQGAAREGRIVVFGVEPGSPHTGYGWIEAEPGEGCRPVRAFVEKPDLPAAVRYLERGMLWNAGIFLFRPSTLIGELDRLVPDVLRAAREACSRAERKEGVVRLDGGAWSSCPSVAIDVAVMEQTPLASVVPVTMGWNDLGSYASLHASAERDAQSNALVGDATAVDCEGCYLHGEDILVTAIGVSDLVVVGTPDAILVAQRSEGARIKTLVEQLGSREEVLQHPRAERPWGRYRVIDGGEGFQVKRLVVRPGEQLSLQLHHHRDEHWIVVQGSGRALVESRSIELEVGGHVFVPVGVAHRLENTGEVDLLLIEVQVGSYLGEDDIERLEDVYGRADER